MPLFLLSNKFKKFNSTGAQMLDSIYHMTLKVDRNGVFGVQSLRFCHIYRGFS